MMKPLPFELLRDSEGSVAVGWAGDSVIFSRTEGGLSAELGKRLATHVQTLVTSSGSVHYFADAAGLTRYDLLARSAFVRMVLAHRRRFLSFTFLIWPTGANPALTTFTNALGDGVEVCRDSEDFERRLLRVAPLALHRIKPVNSQEFESSQRVPR